MNYKVLIADDNPLICKSLRETIHWKKYQCTVVQCAENGKEAWNLITQLKPEIVITDIKMPEMDGLELTDKIRKQYPEILIIMITGYQEFEYAKRAISLGVKELVLKPIDNKKMEEALQKVTDSLSTENEKDEFRKKIQKENAQYIEKERKNEKNNILKNMLLSGSFLESDEILQENSWLKDHNYGIIIGRPVCYDKQIVGTIRQIIEHDFERIFSKNNCVNLIIRQDLVFIIGINKSWSSRSYRVYMKNILYHIQDHIKEIYETPVKVSFCLSSLTTDIKEIICNYEQAEKYLNREMFSGNSGSVIIIQPVSKEKNKSKLTLKDMNNLYQLIETSDQKSVLQEADSIISDILDISGKDVFKAKCLLSEICISLYKYYEKKLPEINQDYSINQILEAVNKIKDVDEGRTYLGQMGIEIQKYNKKQELEQNPTIVQAMEYIRRNYKGNVTLSTLADYLNMNPSYLSRFLKKETGSNFVDILAHVRMEKAKKLLDEGIRVVEVGEQVGYSDYTYFYQVFKRFEGISPSEYKRGKKN